MASEKLSTLFLIAITVVGSTVFYSVFTQTRQASAAVAVEWAEAQVSPTDAVAVINVRNAASKQLRMLELMVQIDGCDVADFKVDLPPGGSYTLTLRNPPGTWLAGETKNAAVKAVFADGSEASTVASVKVYGTSWFGPEDNALGEGPPGRKVFFMDDFKEGLSGWRPWGNATALTVEVDKHGKPSPCLHIFGSGAGLLAGASKTVDVNLTSPATLEFVFDYNVQALKTGGVFPGNLWVRVLSPSGNVLVDEKVYEASSADSGWKNATVTIPPVSGKITLIVYTRLQSPRGQETWIDNVVLSTAG